MKKIKKILIITILTLLTIFIVGVTVLFNIYKKHSYEPVYFELLVSELIFKDKSGSAWDKVSKSEKRPIKWIINEKEFESLDSIYFGFENISNEQIYYMTWGAPNSRIRDNFVVYKNGKADSIPFGGFGCGTGIYLTPLRDKEKSASKGLNPLMFNPYTGYHLPLKNKKFPELFKKLYGDSVSIKFEQATYSVPWNKYPPQMIESNEITISTQKIIDNWKKGKFRLTAESEKEYEMSFYVKEE